MKFTRVLGIIAVLGAVFGSGCPAAHEDGAREGPGPTANAEFFVGSDRYLGAFVLLIGPGERGRFEFNGHHEDARSTNLTGNYELRADEMVRSTSEAQGVSWVTYEPADPWLWIYDNRGALNLYRSSGVEKYKIRSLRYAKDTDDVITVELTGVNIDRLDAESRTILPGGEVSVQVAGMLTGTCWALDDAGRLVEDPMMSVNPFCREMLAH